MKSQALYISAFAAWEHNKRKPRNTKVPCSVPSNTKEATKEKFHRRNEMKRQRKWMYLIAKWADRGMWQFGELSFFALSWLSSKGGRFTRSIKELLKRFLDWNKQKIVLQATAIEHTHKLLDCDTKMATCNLEYDKIQTISPSPSNQGAEGFNYYEDDDEGNFGNFATSRKNPSANKTSSIGSNSRKQVRKPNTFSMLWQSWMNR